MTSPTSTIRTAVRSLSRHPTVAAAAILTLALGIGATTAVFTVVHDVLLRPLPYPEPERLVNVYRLPRTVVAKRPASVLVADSYWIPPAVVTDWQASADAFEALGAYAPGAATVRIGKTPEMLDGVAVTSGVFRALGVAPLVGSTLAPGDDRIGVPRRVVLSYRLWQQRFGGDPGVVGRALVLGGAPATIAGVMPRGFGFPRGDEDIWVSFDDERKSADGRKAGFLQVIARLKPGVSVAQARDAMTRLSAALVVDHPEDKVFEVGVIRRLDVVSNVYGRALDLLLAAVVTVLVIGSANISNLLLIRTTERRREISVRRALGAPRAVLLTAGLAEGVLLALAGGAAGCVVAAASIRPIIANLPFDLPRASEIGASWPVLAFGIGLSVVVGALVGVLPAWRATRESVLDAMRSGPRQVAGGRTGSRLHSTLVVVQVALVVVLLTVAGLFVRSLGELNRAEPGFDAARIVTVNASPPEAPPSGRPAAERDRNRAFYRELQARLLALPGVAAVGASTSVPTHGWSSPPLLVETNGETVRENIHLSIVTTGFFAAMGMPLVSGRSLTEDDRQDTRPVAVVSEGFVRRFWPGEAGVGRRVRLETSPVLDDVDLTWIDVVGVVRDVRFSPARDPMPTVYVPHGQWPAGYMRAVIRADAPGGIVRDVGAVVQAMNGDLAVRTTILGDRLRGDPAMQGLRFAVRLLGSLAAVAAVMALLGIYTALAYGVARRTHEIGIRMALGANRASLVRAVLGQAMLMGATGVGLGAAAAFAAIAAVRSLLVVSPSDPVTLLAVGMVVTAVIAVASAVPARRASRVEPVVALRCE